MAFKLAMLLGLTSLLMVLMVDQTDSVCCKPSCGWFFHRCRCADGFRTTITESCGVGECNSAQCNCVGGCRKASKRSWSEADAEEARSLLEMLEGEKAMPGRGYHDADLEQVAKEARGLLELLRGEQENIYREENAKALRKFGEHDADEDMKLSKEEALEMLKKMGYVDISELPDDWFESMDKDNDGYIDPEEYDEDMAKDLK